MNGVAREIRTLDQRFRTSHTGSAGRDYLESSSGVEPLSVRLEGAGPKSVGEDIGADDEN